MSELNTLQAIKTTIYPSHYCPDKGLDSTVVKRVPLKTTTTVPLIGIEMLRWGHKSEADERRHI